MTIAPLTFLVPIFVACVVALTAPLDRRWLVLGGAVGGVTAAAVLCAVLLGQVGDGLEVLWLGGWNPRPGMAIGIALAVDPFGAGLALFAAALAIPATLLAGWLLAGSPHQVHAISLLFVAAMIAFCLSGDLFTLFVFFELMSVCAYVLVGYNVGKRAPLEGALTFAITNSVGAILLLFGIGLLYGETGQLNLAVLGRTLADTGADTTVVVAFALIAVGFLIKAAAVPFHLWLDDAYGVAPTPVCILLAGVFSELGLYGLARVWWTVFEPALGDHVPQLRAILVGLGLLTALVGAGLALAQHHLKRMLANVTIAHVGIVLVGVAMLDVDGLAGAAIFLVGDGLVKAALFTCVGVLEHRYDVVDVRALHGRGRDLGIVAAVYAVAALAVCGLPPFGSFTGRALIEDAALKQPGYAWVPALLALTSALAGAALLRAGARVFAGWGDRAPVDPMGEAEEDEGVQEAEGWTLRPWMWATGAVLVAASLVWGLVPGLVDAAAQAAATFTDASGYAAAVLDGRAISALPPPVHGPGATSFLYAAGSVGAALAVAVYGLRGEALPAPVRPVVDRVRALHSGHPGDYVAWGALGTTVLTALFALTLT
jgi:multicomponent Na+:H+ antiporter subunit D